MIIVLLFYYVLYVMIVLLIYYVLLILTLTFIHLFYCAIIFQYFCEMKNTIIYQAEWEKEDRFVESKFLAFSARIRSS